MEIPVTGELLRVKIFEARDDFDGGAMGTLTDDDGDLKFWIRVDLLDRFKDVPRLSRITVPLRAKEAVYFTADGKPKDRYSFSAIDGPVLADAHARNDAAPRGATSTPQVKA